MDNFDHVIVDGYNILKKWNYFKNIDDRSLEYKRMLLTHILQSFSDFTDKDLTIVFDGSDNKESLEKNGRVTGDG